MSENDSVLSSASEKSIILSAEKNNIQMAECSIKKMKLNYKFCGFYVFMITFLEIVGKTHTSVHNNNHAFIQPNSNEVRFMGVHEGLNTFMHNGVGSSAVKISNVEEESDKDDALSTSTYLKFEPPQLDFKERFLGVPHLEKVMLVNTDNNKTIHMTSVSGNTLHFHCSFFEDKTIPPKGNTTFAVVFLGRIEGQVSSSLYIHTSEGTLKYHVSGSSIESPYRLRPVGRVRIPLNAAFQPVIHLHNPHHYPIQVVEVYSSGREFRLELPGGEMEGPKSLWSVPPYKTIPVIRANLQANAHSNHTAYIRLKLNNSDILVVPLEVEVTSQPGLYSTQHYIDFGTGGSQEQPKKLKLYLCNSLKKTLRIQSIIAVPPSVALKIDSVSLKIPPGTAPVEVAELSFDWKLGFESKQSSGKILIRSKQNQYKLVIPFFATVLEGCLKINETSTRFLTTDSKPSPRNFTVVNEFKIPLAISNVSLVEKASKYFKIRKFKPLIVNPGKSADIFTIAEKENIVKDVKLESSLVLYTNVSDITVPVLSYNGKLTKIFPQCFEDFELLDVGLVSSGSIKKIRFGLQNSNPVTVELKSIGSNSVSITPQLLGAFYGNVSAFLSKYSFADLTNDTLLRPNAIAVIELVIHASAVEEVMLAQITVVGQYDTLTIPVRVAVAHGSLEIIPKQIVIDDCFPGRICTQVLMVKSTFNRPMTVTAITSIPPDQRLSFSESPTGSEILPTTSSYLSELRWDISKVCGNQCYLGISSNFSNGLRWSDGKPLPPYICDTEATLLLDKYQRFLNITDGVGSGFWQDVVLRLDTNEVKEEMFSAKVQMIWPKLAKQSKLDFPLTQVTNTTVQRLKLYNPASHVILVQLVMEWAYPQPKRLLDSLPLSFKPNVLNPCPAPSPKEFFIAENMLKADHRGVLHKTLAPGESYEVKIAYKPQVPQKTCTALFIRNNLTVMEVIEITGEAAYAQLKFGNRKPGSNSPLMFEISEKHLKDCQKKTKKSPAPNLTVKRSFTARNVGDLPIFVHNFYINGLECEGYGFSILNCGSFELPANGTKKIDVAFTPDFTLSKVQRTLNIKTSLGMEVNYTLIMTLPPVFLSTCSAVLNRPTWEPLLYYSAVSFMAFLLFCVIAAAFFESDRILKCTVMSLSRDRNGTPLDLRLITSSVFKEFSSQSSYKKVDNNVDHAERVKQRDQNESLSNWGNNSVDDRHFFSMHKEDNDNRMHESGEFSRVKDVTLNSGHVQLNNLTKSKKKSGKKNTNHTEGTGDTNHEHLANKKKDKNVPNAGWCNIFSRGTGNAHDKIKLKLSTPENENINHIRNDIEPKKEEAKKDDKKIKLKKNTNKEPTKEEEETSSTMTDSSNDAERENSECNAKIKNDKSKKMVNKKVKGNALESKELYEGDYDDDEMEKEKKIVKPNPPWKGNTKPNKINALPDVNAGMWKPNENSAPKSVDPVKQKTKINLKEKKEKTGNRRHHGDKIGNQKAPEHNTVHHAPSCWEHRSFSDVVGRNEEPTLYSNIVSPKAHFTRQPFQQSSMYPESVDHCEAPVTSALGPIGSKKPFSNWSPYNSNFNPGNIFNMNFAGTPNSFIEANQTNSDFRGEGNSGLEDSLSLDPQNLWEDQHALMQALHQQESLQNSWKENWPDYLWCQNRGVQFPNNNGNNHSNNSNNSSNMSVQENFIDPSWNSLLNNAWSSSAWSPSANQNLHQRNSLENTLNHFGNFCQNSESEGRINQAMLGSNLNIGSLGHNSGQAGGLASGLSGGLASGLSGGQVSGLSSGQVSGLSGGQVSGLSGGQVSGMSGGQVSGMSGGQVSGMSGGQVSGLSGGQVSGLSSGQVSGMSSGQVSGMSSGQVSGQASGLLGQNLFPHTSNRHVLSTQNDKIAQNSNQSDINLVQNSLQFDPFHSFSSIWSPKAQNSWSSPGNQ